MKIIFKNEKFIKIIFGSLIYVLGIFYVTNDTLLSLSIFIVAFIIIGGDVIIKALRNIFQGRIFDENFLMSIATIGAFIIGEYAEGVAVMLFYQVGEFFQSYAVNKSRKSISSLMDISPEYANLKVGSDIKKISPQDINIDDIIVIKPGERVPLDAVIIEGHSMIDTSAITGESVPREVLVGENILSGFVNINGVIVARVVKTFSESTVTKILDLVENATSKKSKSENFITKFARYYTPIIVVVAALIAIIPPLIIDTASFSDWGYRALVFLVISCPCALVISVPLSFFGGIGAASKNGILVKGSNYLEALSKADTVVFDKTGTLTKGVFNVQDIVSYGIDEASLIRFTAYAEYYSNHPISKSLKDKYNKEFDIDSIRDVKELPGKGVIAFVDNEEVAVGNNKLMETLGVKIQKKLDYIGTTVHIAINGEYKGYIIISDEIKDDAIDTIINLKKEKITNTVMLTGDDAMIGKKISEKLGIDTCHAELLPADKVAKLEEIMSNSGIRNNVVFVGDGINDAPVLARADIGIAMGGIGSDAAIEAADVVIMTDEPSKIATSIKISRVTLRIVKQNIVFALSIKFIVLLLGVFGIASMWGAVFADVGVSVIAILNAIRVLNIKY